jgi:hypothetical protein
MELQELISRGRFVFSGAPKRFEVFKLINGKKSTREIARKTGKSLGSTLNDVKKLKDMGIIQPKTDTKGSLIKKDGGTVYEKVPLIRHIPLSYFQDIVKAQRKFVEKEKIHKRIKAKFTPPIVPSENEILDICKSGEDQLYEFKAPGTDIRKLTKEIAAFSNTKMGGLIFYGVEDDGSIIGTDLRRQELDQSLQNSVRNTIAPSPIIEIKEKDVLGHQILIIFTPPWNKKDVYHYEGRVYLRKGTNVFIATPEESRKLFSGTPVV